MKVLVTGAGGFIGKHIIKKLFETDHEVHALGSPRTKFSDLIKQQAASVNNIDISDAANFSQVDNIDQIDAVINCSGIAHRFGNIEESVYQKVNIEGTENVIDFCISKGAKHVIHFSSVLVYGKNKNIPLITEMTPTLPADVYGKSKLLGENAAIKICKEQGIDLTILRPAPVLGEGSKGNFGRLVKAISGRRFMRIGKGNNRKSFVYVNDIADVCLELLAKKQPGIEIFNLAGNAITTEKMLDIISSELNTKLLPFRIPPSFLTAALKFAQMTPIKNKARSISNSLETWLSEDVYSSELIKNKYNVSIDTDIKDAIRKETSYFKQKV